MVIDSPEDGTILIEGDPVTLNARASDTEDGDLSTAIAWRSDVDGALGSGTSVVATLSAGSHVVVARVTDGADQADSMAVSLVIEALRPTNLLLLSADSVVAPADRPLEEPVRIRVLDQRGDAMAGVTVGWEVSAGEGTLDDVAAATDGAGIASAAWMLGPTSAVNELEVAVEGLPSVQVTALSWTLSPDSVSLAEIGDSALVLVELGGEPAADVRLAVASERRWLPELAVVAATPLDRATVRARGPGRAELQVQASGHALRSIHVAVEPEKPLLTSVTSTPAAGGDVPLVLRGFRLDDLPPTSWEANDPLAVLSPDSATVHLLLEHVSTDLCAVSVPDTLVLPADSVVVLADDLTFARLTTREATVLAPGEARLLGPEDVACVVIPAGRYHLAFYDGRYVVQPTFLEARPAELVLRGWTGSATASDAHVRPRPLAPRLPEASAASHVHRPAPDAGPGAIGRERRASRVADEPWEIGDTIEYRETESIPNGLVVVDIVAGYQVIAVPVGNPVSDAILLSVRATLEEYNATHRVAFEELFGVHLAAENGQFLVIVQPYTGGFHGTGSATEMLLWLREGIGLNYGLWIHEITHGFDHALFLQHLEDFDAYIPWNAFDSEGLATFTEFRTKYERDGVPLDSNLPISSFPPSAVFRAWGDLERGYSYAAHYFFDLAAVLADRTGMGWEEAADTIASAATNARYGCVIDRSPPHDILDCDRFEGLYDVVDRLLGGDFDPIESVLDFVLRASADLGAYDHHHVDYDGTGIPPVQVWPAADQGEQTVTLTNGFAGYVLVEQDIPRAFEFTGSSPHMYWKLLRLE